MPNGPGFEQFIERPHQTQTESIESFDPFAETRAETFGKPKVVYETPGYKPPTIGDLTNITADQNSKIPVSYESHQTTVRIGEGDYFVIEHNPPRTARQVLRDRQRMIDTLNGVLKPKERKTENETSDRKPTDANVPMEKLVGFFKDANNTDVGTQPLRVLKGQTIASIMSGKPFGDIGRFGKALYASAFVSLLDEGKIDRTTFDDKNFNKLENLFAEKVREILPEFRRNWKHEMSRKDKEFLSISENSKPQNNLGLDSKYSAKDTQNVLDKPLIDEQLNRPKSGITRQVDGNSKNKGDGSLGQYTDFQQNRRSIVRLADESIYGILKQPGVLSESSGQTGAELNAERYFEVGKKAAEYRNAHGKGGKPIGPESAELYTRVFRALGVSRQEALQMKPSELGQLFDQYISTHSEGAQELIGKSSRTRANVDAPANRSNLGMDGVNELRKIWIENGGRVVDLAVDSTNARYSNDAHLALLQMEPKSDWSKSQEHELRRLKQGYTAKDPRVLREVNELLLSQSAELRSSTAESRSVDAVISDSSTVERTHREHVSIDTTPDVNQRRLNPDALNIRFNQDGTLTSERTNISKLSNENLYRRFESIDERIAEAKTNGAHDTARELERFKQEYQRKSTAEKLAFFEEIRAEAGKMSKSGRFRGVRSSASVAVAIMMLTDFMLPENSSSSILSNRVVPGYRRTQ